MSNSKKIEGKIGVQSDNMFPIIKKFLYSDNEIFLREIVSNAVDATQKLRTLSSKGEYTGELGDLRVEVKIDGDKLIISDSGVGMTAEEIDKYINQIAISGAEEFVEKHKDDAASIIGHFGLGFYSAFMVSKEVEIYTQSYDESAPSMRWRCKGDPEFILEEAEKRPRGTDVILHIDEDSKEFLDKLRIRTLLEKYCRFLPVPIVFGKQTEWKDGAEVETDKDLVINETHPLWTRTPGDLKDEDYQHFYQMLYPMSDEPLFWIHLNIDYPFNLTGILYFPQVKSNIDLQKNKIQLFSNQVFVTDNVEGIVPEFLGLLHGVLDSPDIPLNVSRSYLQSDHNVKKISSYITRKVADKLSEIFKEDRKTYEEKWPALDLFVKYGMLSEEKFYDRAEQFVLLQDSEDKLYTLDEYRTLISGEQTDKEGNVVYLYAVDCEQQYAYIKDAKNKGYNVLLLRGPLDIHFISMLEQKVAQSRFVRVDSDTLDNLIPKERDKQDELEVTPEEEALLISLFDQQLPSQSDTQMLSVQASHQGKDAKPLIVVQSEYMRRMKDMAQMQPGMQMYGTMPDSYVLKLNLDNPTIRGIAVVFNNNASAEEEKKLRGDKKGYQARMDAIQQQLNDEGLDDATKATLKRDKEETQAKIAELNASINELYKNFGDDHAVIAQLIDLGLLSSGLLKGEALDAFVTRSMKMLKN